MRHNVAGRKLKRTASHKKALMCNMATSLFEHKRLVTTVAKAKELRPFAEQLITRAKHALAAEKAGATPKGVDVHNRRMVGRFIRNKGVLQELFDTIAPIVAERSGGYTRIIKIGIRRGDNAPEAVIELVDWSNPVDGRISATTRAKAPAKPKKAKPVVAAKAPVAVAEVAPEPAEVAAEQVAEVEETLVVNEVESPALDVQTEIADANDAAATDDDAAAEEPKADA